MVGSIAWLLGSRRTQILRDYFTFALEEAVRGRYEATLLPHLSNYLILPSISNAPSLRAKVQERVHQRSGRGDAVKQYSSLIFMNLQTCCSSSFFFALAFASLNRMMSSAIPAGYSTSGGEGSLGAFGWKIYLWYMTKRSQRNSVIYMIFTSFWWLL